jgi:chemotaxis protein MotB
MKPKYLQGTANQTDRWMVSYMDVLSILLLFFLVAAAKALEVHPVAAAIAPLPAAPPPAAPPPPPKPADPEPLHSSLLPIQERLEQQGLDSKLDGRGLVINLDPVVLFGSGDDTVSPQALPTLARIADVLRDIPNEVRLVGHADAVPIHNHRFHSNWDLSMARSQHILELLSGRYGVPESRLSLESYGAWRPAASNDTRDGRAANRRVEIAILDGGQPAN